MNKGFTLVEVIVVTGLVAILVVVGGGIYLANSRFYETQSGEILAIHNTREVGDRLSDYGRGAVAILSSYTYNSVVYNTGADTVIFQVPSQNQSGGIISGSFDYVIVGTDPANASRLLLIVDPAAGSKRLPRTRELTNQLASLGFTYDNADLSQAKNMTYQITVTQSGRSPGSEQIFGGVTLRNK